MSALAICRESTLATGDIGVLTGPIRIVAVTGHGFDSVDAALGFMLDSRIQRRFLRRVGSV